MRLIAAGALVLSSVTLRGEPVAVKHTEGIVHGFLALRTLEGATIANGDLIQLARGTRVTSRLTFRFKDGSLHDETAVFSQRGRFQLISDHLVQKGGISGVLAPLLGKQPPDSHVWILGGDAPAFVRSEQALYLGGPTWRIELVSLVWPRTAK
jgi:hypothetical protein